MNTVVSLVVVLVVPVGLIAAFLTAPRWFVRIAQQNRLWALRDDLVDDVLAGRLPAAHPSVKTLVDESRVVATHCTSVSLAMLLAYRRSLRRNRDLAASIRAAHKRETRTAGLTAEQRELLAGHRNKLQMALQRNLMFGSWLGIAFVVVVFLRAVARGVVRLIASVGRASLSGPVHVKVKDAAHEPSHRLDELVDGICFPAAAVENAHATR